MSRRVLAQVVARLRRSRNHLQAQVKLLRRIRNQPNHQTSAVSNEENDNQASAVAPKASSQEQAQAGATDGGQVAEATTPASQVGGVEGGRGAWTATSGTLTLDEETPVYAAPDKDSGAVSTLLPEMLTGINMKFYLMETGIVLLRMVNVIIFHIQM